MLSETEQLYYKLFDVERLRWIALCAENLVDSLESGEAIAKAKDALKDALTEKKD